VTTKKPIGPDEMPEETGELLREVFDLADELAATISDEQIEERLAKLLTQDGALPPYVYRVDWSQTDWPTLDYVNIGIAGLNGDVTFVEAKRNHLDYYVDRQLDRANEIKANAQAEATQIIEDARTEATLGDGLLAGHTRTVRPDTDVPAAPRRGSDNPL
jgi:hypothetical protein